MMTNEMQPLLTYITDVHNYIICYYNN